MPCNHCLAYVEDILWFPSQFQSKISPTLLKKHKRNLACEIESLLSRVRNHHYMVRRVKTEYLALVKNKLHTPAKPLEIHLFDVAVHYYDYCYPNKEKQTELKKTIEYLCLELVSLGIVRCKRNEDPLLASKLWFLDKYFHFVEHLESIHSEHSKLSVPHDLRPYYLNKGIQIMEVIPEEEIRTWDDLYT